MKTTLPLFLLFLLAPLPVISQEGPKLIEVTEPNAEAVQEALNALPPSLGGIVKLPPGTIEISKPLVVSTPETRITGAGASTHIQNTNESGEPAFLLRPPTLDEDKDARLWRVQMDNFRISGNEKSGHGIQAEKIQEIFLQGLSIDHHGGHGIALLSCFEDPRISDSIITYNKNAGIYLHDCHDIVVNANHFEENEDALVCADCFNLCMNGNNIDDHLRHGVVIENTYGSVVSGNMIEECMGTAIILDRDCYGITLSANVIAHDMGGGVDLKDAHGCGISANTFTIVHEFGVRVSVKSGRNTISANSFSNSYMGDGKTKRDAEHENKLRLDVGNGVVLEGTSHNTISGNTFSGMDGSAVRASGTCGKNLVSGNLVTDFNRRAGDQAGEAFATEGNDQIILTGNVVD